LQSGTWLAHGEVFRELPTAALDRVCNARVDAWMPHAARAKTLRRLQNEMQMLLYTHPVNDERAAMGLPAINAFWASGTGSMPASATSIRGTAESSTNRAEMSAHANTLDAGHAMVPEAAHALRSAVLRDDADAWLRAWSALDNGVMTELVQRAVSAAPSGAGTAPLQVTLTLCGENTAASFNLQHTSTWSKAWTRLRRSLSPTEPAALLQSL
jgi:hypothetical protein